MLPYCRWESDEHTVFPAFVSKTSDGGRLKQGGFKNHEKRDFTQTTSRSPHGTGIEKPGNICRLGKSKGAVCHASQPYHLGGRAPRLKWWPGQLYKWDYKQMSVPQEELRSHGEPLGLAGPAGRDSEIPLSILWTDSGEQMSCPQSMSWHQTRPYCYSIRKKEFLYFVSQICQQRFMSATKV